MSTGASHTLGNPDDAASGGYFFCISNCMAVEDARKRFDFAPVVNLQLIQLVLDARQHLWVSRFLQAGRVEIRLLRT